MEILKFEIYSYTPLPVDRFLPLPLVGMLPQYPMVLVYVILWMLPSGFVINSLGLFRSIQPFSLEYPIPL